MSLDDLTHKPVSSYDRGAAKTKRSLSWLLPVGLLAGFALIFYLLFGERLHPSIDVEAAPVITIRLKSNEITQEPALNPESKSSQNSFKGQLLFQASGWVEPAPYTTYVPTLIDGVVSDVHALEGQVVKKGDLLATLIADDAQLDFNMAIKRENSLKKEIAAHCAGFGILKSENLIIQQQIKAQMASVENAKDAYTRLSKLKKGVVSQQSVVEASTELERQKALLEETQTKLNALEAQRVKLELEKSSMNAQLEELDIARQRARLALDRTKIYAPIDGVVLQLHAAPGMKRMLGMDSPTSATIIELYDPMQLQARIDVALNEASALSVGQPVELVSDLLPDQTFMGVVTRITGQADLQRNTLQAKVEIESPDPRLRPDMLVRAKFYALFQPNTTQNTGASLSGRLALYVPAKAILNDSQVWVISTDSRAELRTIKLGNETRDDHHLVIEGLRSGEFVILSPQDQLLEGSRVNQTTQH